MFAALNNLAQTYPVSKWNEDGLMAAGNYHWVELEREQAAVAYQHVLDSFPNGKHAYNCEWRIAWVAYLDHQPDADDRLTNFLLKYPTSARSEEHTSELQSRLHLVCRLLLEKKKSTRISPRNSESSC